MSTTYFQHVKNFITRYNLTLFIKIICIILINSRAGISQQFCTIPPGTTTSDLISNKDTSICLGDFVLLNTYNSVIDPCWENNSSLSFQDGKVIAKPTTTTTYRVFSKRFVPTNLVKNGDFSAGRLGIDFSDYDPTNPNTPGAGIPEGVYTVGNSTRPWHPSFSDCKDHTTGSGNMMIVNGDTALGAVVWQQTITNITPNSDYVFSSWLETLNNFCAGGCPPTNANLRFFINGVEIGRLDGVDEKCVWNQFYATWPSGSATTAVISW